MPRLAPSRPRRKRSVVHSRPPLERMKCLHEKLKAGKFPNCRKLGEELEVSPKTIQRDIDFMRDRLNLPIEYDQLHFGYWYTEPVTSFPSIEVTEGELVALFVARKAMEQYRGTPFEKPLAAAFEKITEGLNDTIEFKWADVDSAISFRGTGASIADLELFETVGKATFDLRELSFEYRKLGGARYESRRVQPYHLACVENQWYLFAFDLARQQLRTFSLPRMRKARNTGTRFKRPADFSITTHLGDSFGVFTGKAVHKVRIRFDAFASRLVGERQWHPSQKIRRLRGGEIELSLEVGGLEEIERWVLSWGGHARVLEPRALVERIREAAETIGRTYGTGE